MGGGFDATAWDFQRNLVLVGNYSASLVFPVDPAGRGAPSDTMLRDAWFPMLSPDGRWLVYGVVSTGQTFVTPFPARKRQFQIASDAGEAVWLTSTSLVSKVPSGDWFEIEIDPKSGEPIGKPKPWWADPRFAETPGWSHRPSHDGGIIYKQGPEQTSAAYLRVVPNWVAQMKRAVDQANPP